MSSPTADSDTEREREEFVGVLRTLARPESFDEHASDLVSGCLMALREAEHHAKRGYSHEIRETARGMIAELNEDIERLRFVLTIRKFPAFRRALCEAVAQETGMKVADVIALATPKE